MALRRNVYFPSTRDIVSSPWRLKMILGISCLASRLGIDKSPKGVLRLGRFPASSLVSSVSPSLILYLLVMLDTIYIPKTLFRILSHCLHFSFCAHYMPVTKYLTSSYSNSTYSVVYNFFWVPFFTHTPSIPQFLPLSIFNFDTFCWSQSRYLIHCIVALYFHLCPLLDPELLEQELYFYLCTSSTKHSAWNTLAA